MRIARNLGENMKDPEDEAFEQLALKQGQWEHTSGNRKRQIMRQIEQDFADIDDANNRKRNHTLEEVAVELETKFTMPFGRDTVQSFVAYIRGMKR
jgi:hypothetical protein